MLLGGSLRRRRFAETETALAMGETARVWRSSPSLVLGLPGGSLDAFILDRRVAERLADDADREGSGADVPPAVPDGGVGLPMPDPTAVPWAVGHEPVLGG